MMWSQNINARSLIFNSGRGLVIQHFRHNPECGGLEELEPIDQNLNYDFNFQQFVHLPKEHVVLPVRSLFCYISCVQCHVQFA